MKILLWKRCDLNYTAVWHGYDIVEKNLNTLSIKYIRFFMGDLCLLLDSPLMMKGVDRNAKIVIDIEDKVTALAEKDTIQNRTACIMRSLKSLIGEISNYASCYHNKTPKTEKQKETYSRYVDLLSITNGGFAVVKPRECLISSVA